jgi:hypothetical protein
MNIDSIERINIPVYMYNGHENMKSMSVVVIDVS